MFEITEEARKVMQEMLAPSAGETFIRYSIKSECCNQMNYALSIARQRKEGDQPIRKNGVDFLVHPADMPYLEKTVIDYQNGGFWIGNRNPLVAPLQ